MSSRRSDGEISSSRTGFSDALVRTSSGISDSVALMRSRRSASTARASRKMLDNAWPPICAIDGYGDGVVVRGPAGSRMRPAPTTRMRSAPRWIAGEIGAVWRIDPSPNHSLEPASGRDTAGNMNGIAADASRCPIVIGPGTASRLERIHGWNSAAD